MQKFIRNTMIAIAFLTMCYEAQMGAQFFKKEPFTYNQKIDIDVEGVGKIAQEVSTFLQTAHTSKYVTIDEGSCFKGMITLDDVKETIQFLAEQAKKNPKQLKHHWFYSHYFDFYRWHTDGCLKKMGHIPRGWPQCPEAIRLTKYRVGKIHGSLKKTEQYDIPLYELPEDEKGKLPSYIASHREDFLRFSYTRTAIFEGALEGNAKTKVLAWVDFDGYKELLMQGSGIIYFGFFSPSLHIKIAGSNGKQDGEKYWFSVIHQTKKNSKKFPVKVEPVPGVSFAGNIEALGFGKVILLVGKNQITKEKEMRLGVLVDTGTAFKDNLCKLDLFVGHFENQEIFNEHCKQYPHTAHAYVLIKKKKKSRDLN